MTEWPWWVGFLVGVALIMLLAVVEIAVDMLRFRRAQRREREAYVRRKLQHVEVLDAESLVRDEVRRLRAMVYPREHRGPPS